jgi:hypothetical protein
LKASAPFPAKLQLYLDAWVNTTTLRPCRRRAALTQRRRLETVPAMVHVEDPDARDVRPTEPSPRPRDSVGVPIPTGSDPQHLSKFIFCTSN